MNISPDVRDGFDRTINERLPWNISYSLHYCGWRIAQYAHLVGLDNRWTMFAHNSHFNWWYVVKAQYADSSEATLPMPDHGARTFWQKNFFDFREAKLDLNIYSSIIARRAYSSYLRRQYPLHGDAPLTSITWELQSQDIFDPMEARARGSHLDPTIRTQLLNRFDYTAEGGPL